MLVVILASAWKQVSYNFIFFLAGFQSIPRAVIEAARHGRGARLAAFRTILLPLLMPTIFFLLVVNLVLRRVRYIRHHPGADPGRSGQGHGDAGREGVSGRA